MLIACFSLICRQQSYEYHRKHIPKYPRILSACKILNGQLTHYHSKDLIILVTGPIGMTFLELTHWLLKRIVKAIVSRLTNPVVSYIIGMLYGLLSGHIPIE